MKLCPKHPIKLPKDFVTRLADPSVCTHHTGCILSNGKLHTTSSFSRRMAWYDKATPKQRLSHQIKSDKYYKPIGENNYELV